MLPPKITLHPLHGLRTPTAAQDHRPNKQEQIADLQQTLNDIEESQDRTSFFLGELTLWAANLRPKA